MMTLLFLAACFLAYANGANGNFKGVASLFGSKTTNYRTAIWWATVTTFAGSVCSIFLAGTLLKRFSGKGLVPDAIVSSPDFLLAVALGAGLTVILATVTGFPISTTHGLTGAIVGSGLVAAGTATNFSSLGTHFALPLLLSPLLAVAVGAVLYVALRWLRLKAGITKEWCLCVGQRQQAVAMPQPTSVLAMQEAVPLPEIATGEAEHCSQRYAGRVIGLEAQKIMDALHFLSAGAVGFARGLNDAPKIAALLLMVPALDMRWGIFAIAAAMAVGGLLNARKVAETMSHRITGMNHGQGFAANLATSLLVIGASRLGMPVSTTHVSVGALFGIGLTTQQANHRVVGQILLSWVLTLPCAALLAALAYLLLKSLR
ncbi:MAG: inorganic phosphate transporter [Verrucomicrobiota bacterium]